MRTSGTAAEQSLLDAHAACDAAGAPRVREVTGETITDQEIRRLEPSTTTDSDIVHAALHHASLPARARCAAMFNRLPESERLLTLAERIRWIAAAAAAAGGAA